MQHKKCKTEEQFRGTSPPMDSADSEIRSIPGQWSELPSLPLGIIYSFLNHEDQVNMSVVCSHWSDGYHLPYVWKTFIFDLTEEQLKSDNCPVTKFVPKYSKMFKHVEIRHQEYGGIYENWISFYHEKCNFFLRNLTINSDLTSILFDYKMLNRLCFEFDIYEDIYRTFVDFLGSQRNLKRVVFKNCSCLFREGVEFLGKFTENSKESLTHLAFQRAYGYFPKAVEPASSDVQKLPLLEDFPSLKTLEMDYSVTFLNMARRQSTAIQTLKHCQKLQLSKIVLKYVNGFIILPPTENCPALTTTDWNNLKELYPHLELELELKFESQYFSFSQQEFKFLIAPSMQIRRLKCTFVCFEETESNDFFTHLLNCDIADNLVSLTLEWEFDGLSLASTIIRFLEHCKKLNSLELYFVHPVVDVDILMTFLLENKPVCLEGVLIDIKEITEEGNSNVRRVASECESRLLMANINLEVEFRFHMLETFRI